MTKPTLMKLSELLPYFESIKVNLQDHYIIENALYISVSVFDTEKIEALAFILNLRIAIDSVSVYSDKIEIYGISDN